MQDTQCHRGQRSCARADDRLRVTEKRRLIHQIRSCLAIAPPLLAVRLAVNPFSTLANVPSLGVKPDRAHDGSTGARHMGTDPKGPVMGIGIIARPCMIPAKAYAGTDRSSSTLPTLSARLATTRCSEHPVTELPRCAGSTASSHQMRSTPSKCPRTAETHSSTRGWRPSLPGDTRCVTVGT
jgi:hypothetical protein